MECRFCHRPDAGTTSRGLARHETICKSNPANLTEAESVGDRVHKRAEAKLDEVERLVTEIAEMGQPGDSYVGDKGAAAVAAFKAYRELVALLGAA